MAVKKIKEIQKMKQSNEMQQIAKQEITALNINDDIVKILNKNKIKTIGQLTRRTKSDLRLLTLKPKEINKLVIELQLQGVDLRNNL